MKLALGITLALAAINIPAGAAEAGPTGEWTLKSMIVEGVETQALPAPASATLSLDGKTFSGNTGVNSYFGKAKLTDGRFKHRGVSVTEMAALDPAAMKQEMAFLKLFPKMTRYARDGADLLLSDGTANNQLRFARPVKVKDKPLRGTRWVLTGFEESDGHRVSHSAAADGTTVDLLFAQENAVSGTAGVNRFKGTYYALETSPKLAVRKVATTMMAGEPEAMAQEAKFLKRLQEATRFAIAGDRLTLADKTDTHRILFEAAK